MAKLSSAIDSAFWDQRIATPRTIEGSAKSVPGDPFPLDGARASRELRVQQLSFLGNGFPLGIIPSFSPPSRKELGSLALQSFLFRASIENWWVATIGQIRPKKLVSSIKEELSKGGERKLHVFREAAKCFLDKSLYSVALCTQLALSSATSLLLSGESHGEKEGFRSKLMLYHRLRDHDLTLEAGWPELYIDHKGNYWDVPVSISLDMSSLESDSGFNYRFGIHQNSGNPQAFNSLDGESPSALRPGLCAKAAFSYEKGKEFWRQETRFEDMVVKIDNDVFLQPPSYDLCLSEPHAAISGLVGGMCAAWFGGKKGSISIESEGKGDLPTVTKKRIPFSADLFGSVCYTFQHGRFRNKYGDLTRVDARLDMCSVSALAKRIFKGSSVSNNIAYPRLNLIFQQQVAGPVVVRLDSKFLLGPSSGERGPVMEDLILSLNYSLRLLRSGKVVAWYSPKRKEGMIELRLFEF
ncbi:hypothetical protein SLEP1_g2806 [Rubroshorea leprosula]|uniref:Protein TRIGALACTOSYLDIACYLGLYCEROL 4, chloroplastic n=1 Tax=Rubroshorea leprosula TaxID=152421 RepID=A0AAV5HMQ4_9ROSI|nr:hypothetical protein SLEP1_g2806 [Rubroshorea leprosula]